jgi:hypothetical protein
MGSGLFCGYTEEERSSAGVSLRYGRILMLTSEMLHVEFGFQLSICSRTEENDRKSQSSWNVAGPCGCKLTFSQKSGIQVSPYECCCFIMKSMQTRLAEARPGNEHFCFRSTCISLFL